MKNILLFVSIFNMCTTIAQVKIDSLGFHLGKDNQHIIEAPNKSAEDIRSLLVKHVNENNWEISNTEGSDYMKIKMSDNFMLYLLRTGVDGYIGQNTTFEIDVKDGKCRIRNMNPSFFFVFGGIDDRPDFIPEKKKKHFAIVGDGNTLYDRDKILRRSRRKTKPQIESYFNNIITGISEVLNSNGESDW